MIRRLDLPSPGCDRWTPQRKAAVVTAVSVGELTFDAVQTLYGVTRDEIVHWADRLHRFGLGGLSVHKLQAVGR